MRVAVGCDHAGFPLKATIIDRIEAAGHTAVDCGTYDANSVDYPDYASAVAAAMLRGDADRGVVLCGSGVGAAVAANKIKGIRAGLCHDVYSAHQGVEHDDINLLCLGGRIVGISLAEEILSAFLGAEFTGEDRHRRRLDKVLELEQTQQPFTDRP